MNDFYYLYMKQRKDFGRYPQFEDVEPKILGAVERNFEMVGDFVEQTVLNVTLDNIPETSEHAVNTARVQVESRGVFHCEGGWPREIDASEPQDTAKFRKRIEKDPACAAAVSNLCQLTTKIMQQNCTIDVFEHYYHEEEPETRDPPGLKGVAVFRDPADEARSITKISWHPEGPTKIVGSYCMLKFQRMSDEMNTNSYVWDVNDPNVPLVSLRTQSPMICCAYNHKSSDLLIGGCYNGIMNHYDLRKGATPVLKSQVETSHFDPVYDVTWLQSKTGTEAVSVSSDGRLMMWDVRDMSKPTETCELTDGNKEKPRVLGASSLEWMQEAGPTKYLVGTELGMTLQCQNKPKKPVEVSNWFGNEEKGGFGAHYGPVYGLKRNPFHVKYFLTVGDWTAKLWMEEQKSPLIVTPYNDAPLSAVAWSPTRAGVFSLADQGGRLHIWDYYYRMNAPVCSHQISDAALTSLALQAGGKLMAVGDAKGAISLVEFSESLVVPTSNEKNVVGQIFDRETNREKNLDALRKAAKRPGDAAESAAPKDIITSTKEQEEAFEADFLANVGISK